MWRLLTAFFCVRALAGGCEDLATVRIAHGTVQVSEAVKIGTFSPPAGTALSDLPPFCRVAVTARPSSDSEIKIEIWMPEKGWNGHLEGTGNGGFAGHFDYRALSNGLKLGYAVVNTDMGMATPAKADARIFVNRPERWADWGYRATHEMTVAAKQFVKAYYHRPLQQAYFAGCSTGGEQALMEAERFPDDYDGIVAGAPAHNRTGVHMSILWNFAVTEADTASYFPPAKLPLISGAVQAACNAKDGVISDPSQCKFDPAALQCTGQDGNDCLTRPQVETVRKLYAGPTNPRTGEKIYPGLPKGSEFGWDHLGPPPAIATEPPFAPIFEWVFGPHWDWRSFDFDKSVALFEKKLAGTLNATSTNLDQFRSRGGKLILYHGWADWLVAPEETIRYYDAVLARNQKARDSVRFFMVPGMAHCGGGPGADRFDALHAVASWVENGQPPDKLIATKLVSGKTVLRRLLCAYPQVAAYRGSGDANDDRSYRCVEPSSVMRRKS